MGLRINLQHASWLAHILKPSGVVPPLDEESSWQQSDVLNQFIRQLDNSFYSGRGHEKLWREEISHLAQAFNHVGNDRTQFLTHAIDRVRHFLSERPWTALILPSGSSADFDRRLCDERLLQQIVGIRPDDPGLILQLQEPPSDALVLKDLFPAFRTALASVSEWPGVLIWKNSGDAKFFPIDESPNFTTQLHWLFSRLAESQTVDLERLGTQYHKEFTSKKSRVNEVTVIHLSDIHIGSKQSSLRLPRLTQLVRNTIEEIGEHRKFVIAISGDLMDNPDERNLNEVRLFLDGLANLTDEALVTCLGNHDVRTDGYLADNLKMALRLPATGGAVRTFCDNKFGIVSFNSVVKGKLARGFIGEQQMADIANDLDRNRSLRDTRFIGMVHHHPVPVEVPKWYARPFYEKWLGSAFEKTDSLEDAENFLAFIESRKFGCVIHGHKHIPHIGKSNGGVPIYGCGSSVGKVDTVDKQPYMSLNLINYNLDNNRLSTRLLAERVPGGGLIEESRTEVLTIPKPPGRIR